ncbi:MAG: hypothetical protein ACOC7U_06745 [Spirochaetota bacterium]
MKKLNRFLLKLNRFAAYILLANTLVLLVTGYRTMGYFRFFSRNFADIFHRYYLAISFTVLFVIHSFLSIRLVLMRHKIKGPLVDAALGTAGGALLGLFLYVALA